MLNRQPITPTGGRDHCNDWPASIGMPGRDQSEQPADFIGMRSAGTNPDRLKSDASFAALCGVSPVPASSGRINRHRLNRGGDRAANSALHIIAVGRLRCDERTQTYVKRRITEGLSKLEALRCLKRYIVREVYYLIRSRYRQINQSQIAT